MLSTKDNLSVQVTARVCAVLVGCCKIEIYNFNRGCGNLDCSTSVSPSAPLRENQEFETDALRALLNCRVMHGTL